jgi:hypothetical protein
MWQVQGRLTCHEKDNANKRFGMRLLHEYQSGSSLACAVGNRGRQMVWGFHEQGEATLTK